MSILNTRLQNFRDNYEGGPDHFEDRFSRYGTFEAFKSDTMSVDTILTPKLLNDITSSFNTPVQYPVIDRGNIPVTAVRNVNITDFFSDTQLVTANFVTLVSEFTMDPAAYVENYVGYEQDFNRNMVRVIRGLSEAIETQAAATLDANINQFFPAATFVYPDVANAFQVPLAEHDNAYNQLGSIMNIMDYYGDMNVVASTAHRTIVDRFRQQGSGNATNLGWQYAGYNWFLSNSVSKTAAAQSTAYVMPKGTIAIAGRVDNSAKLGWEWADGVGSELTTTVLPMLGETLPVAAYYTKNVANRSAIAGAATAGDTRAMREGFQFSLDVCFLVAYNSDPVNTYSPVVKVDFL